jgi:hypothetical protein
VIESHIKSAKDAVGNKCLGSKEKTEHNIAEALKVSYQNTHPVGEILPEDQQVYRCNSFPMGYYPTEQDR